MSVRETGNEKQGSGFYGSAYGERRKKRHQKGRTRMNILLGILILLVLLWLFLPNPSAPPPSDPGERTREFPAASSNGTNTSSSSSIDQSTAALPPEAVAPNPMLEIYVDQELREGPYRFEVNYPNKEATLSEQADGTHLFRISGNAYTEEEEIALPFRVHLFSNKPADYENFQPIFTEDLVFQVEGDHYIFQLSHPEELDPGLYYYLIEEAESGEVYGVGKVTVL
ncbi:MAG: hypothetical protein R2824_09020 [Saprospiraceae bacterium]|nr:hypothetical protein [Lewinella sp.]